MEPSKDWKEIITANEDQRFALFASQLTELQRLNAVDGKAGRALHHKFNGGCEAKFEILANLPEPARHGLFAAPTVYDALVRYSNGASAVQPDDQGDVRGMAVKVLGVDGPKVLGSAHTQDFLSILQSVTPFRTADEFVGIVYGSRSRLLALPRMLFAVGLRTFLILPKLMKAVKQPVASLADRRFFSALPIQCGPYAVRFAFMPITAPDGDVRTTGANLLAGDLASRLRKGPIEYAMELQFFVDEKRTPIEDGSVDWPVEIAPYVRVAKLTLSQQDAASEHGKRIAERIDRLSFDPWHALVEHRPLGMMMRSRKPTYFASSQERSAEPEPKCRIL
jgi:hypothetical protein